MARQVFSNKNKISSDSQQFPLHDLDQPLTLEVPLEATEYLKTDKNFDKICRVCLNINQDLVPIFDRKVQDNMVLADMFISITSIEIYPEDCLPSNICVSCMEQIIHCYDFKELCTKSYVTLKTILKEDLVLTIKSDDSSDWPTSSKTVDYDAKTECDSSVQDVLIFENELESEDIAEKQNDECKANIVRKCMKSSLEVSQNHKQIKSNIKWYTCSVCSKRFKKLKTLKIHLKLKHGPEEKPFSCNDCKEAFILKKDLQIHSAVHAADGNWECIECHKLFTAKNLLKRHVKRHMEEKRYKCDVCNKAFTELYALGRHRRTHTGEALEKKHACHICSKRYAEASALRSHLRRHTGERPFTCSVCGKTFPSARLLRSHMLTHDDFKPHKCNYCDKRFRHESTRNTHHRTHTGEKPYVCSACGKTFIQSSNLTLHMRTHSGEKPYSCENCNRKFSSWSSLKTHERIHTGEKPYSCEECGKRFARKDMRAHMRRHTGEAPFVCEVCNKHFTTRSRLRDHKRVHTGEKPFECAICDQKYSTKSQLLKHIKMHNVKKSGINNARKTKTQSHNKSLDKTAYHKHCIEESVITANIVDCNEEVINIDPKEITIEPELPLEVTAKLELEDECKELKTEIVLVDQGIHHSYQLSNINLINNGIHLEDNTVNLVTVNEGDGTPSQSTVSVECARVKLYHLDQNLLEIHTSGSKLTFSKITSKIKTEYE